jgi:thioesterase domain-containing protein
MACQLETAGECVALVAILDTPAPSAMYSRRERRHAGAPPREHGVSRRARWFVRAASRQTRDRLAYRLAGFVTPRGEERYSLFYRMAARLTHRYRPATTVAGPVVVMTTSDSRIADDLGWSSHVRGTVTTVVVPGDHNSMLRRPYVASLGAELSAAIETSLR